MVGSRWPILLLLAFFAFPLLIGATATPALAAPEWGIAIEHHNAYGAQRASCPTSKEEYFPTDPERDCGVDPFTGSGTTFARESGFNEYQVRITNVGNEEVSGAHVGGTVTCSTGKWATAHPTPTFTYQWLRNGTPINGATANTYKTTEADASEPIQCAVTGTNSEGADQNVSAAFLPLPEPATSPPSIAAKPTITGTAAVGATLTCSVGTWEGSPTAFEYQWLRAGVPIPAATIATYVVTSQDLEKGLQCEVAAENTGGRTVSNSIFKSVLTTPPIIASKPTIVGSATLAGEPLECSSGSWNDSPESYSYKWLRDGAPIAGATSSKYTLVAADEGKAIQCQVTAQSTEGTSTAISTATVASVSPGAPATIAVTGPKEVGGTRTCSHGSWSNSPSTYEYVWLRDGAPISGADSGPTTASSFSYTQVTADAGKTIECEVIASNTEVAVAAISPGTTGIERSYPRFTASGEPPTLASQAEPTVVTDRLPQGLLMGGTEPGTEAIGTGWSCESSGNGTIAVCTRSDSLAADAEYPPLTIHTRVDDESPLGSPPTGGDTNIIVVAGGGAPEAHAGAETTIAPAVSFGIESFVTSVTNPLVEPFTQAAGHPFAASAEFVFNSTPDASGELRTAGGVPKAIQTELPAGFIGDPQGRSQCAAEAFQTGGTETPCPIETAVGFIQFSYEQGAISKGKADPMAGYAVDPVYELRPAYGYPASFGFIGGLSFAHFTLNATVRSDGDYGITISSPDTSIPPLLAAKVTFCGNGVEEEARSVFRCRALEPHAAPFLTTPAQCTGGLPATTLRADTYEDPGQYVSKTVYNGTRLSNGNPSLTESIVTGCNLLQFAPEIEYGPSADNGTTQAGQPTGATFSLKVPQTSEAEKPATPELKNATVTLPEGMTADPSAAGGLEACSNTQFGLGSTVEPAEPAACPAASQVGTVKIVTPLLEKPLEGQVFIGEPECSLCSSGDAEQGHLFRLFVQARLAERGVIVKLAGKVSANPITGRLQATFTEQPQLPFSELTLALKSGPRAPLANPQTCGAATTTTDMTPWSAPGLGGLSGTEVIEGTPDATPSSMFSVDWDGKGGACPATLPFSPSFLAQTESSAAGQYSPLSVSFGRPEPSAESEERDEQNLAGISLNMPEGLLGKIAGVEQCPEVQANAGTCPAASEIGTATVGAGAGSHPYYLTGQVFLTGPYKGDPFGLSIAVPAEAGPFRLAGNTGTGLEVVRAGIAVNSNTAALTVTSDPLPQIVDGVPLRLHDVRVDVNRADFTLNPTSCAAGQQIAGSITGAPVNQGEAAKTASVSAPFAATGCAALPFHPTLTASTSGITGLKSGASLNVTIAASAGEANIGKVDLTLPKALPARLSTLHQACTEAQFASNPAACPEGSDIGTATARTPLLSGPLSGPVYLVSHGGAEFPDVEMVLQGENGLEIILDGQTQITGDTTYSRFESVPDAPITSFETSLPEGSHSIFGSSEALCTAKNLNLGATLTGQNGAQTVQSVPITVTGCPAATTAIPKPTVKIEKARVSGSTIRVTVKITAKGRLSLSGAGLRTAKRTAAAGTVTLTSSLTKTERTKLRKRRRTRLKLRVGYVPTTGASSAQSTNVTFR